MNSGQAGWLLLLILGLFLMIIGVQGNLGQVVAVVFCPKYISIDDSGTGTAAGTDTTTGGGKTLIGV